MKILYVTTVSSTMAFFVQHIKFLQIQGHTIELACQLQDPLPSEILKLGCVAHPLPFSRSPLCLDNLKAYNGLKKLLQQGQYDIVHVHTPNAAACVRLAARKLRYNGLKVMYTAHGFHFYKGAPLKNWLLYYPIEWLCAQWTDVLITVNQEDYEFTKKHMSAKQIYYVPGVGVNLNEFTPLLVDKSMVRQMLGIPDDACMCLSVGELNKNKNHKIIIRAIAQLDDYNIHYCIAGSGFLMEELHKEIATLGLEQQVHLLGYRSDVQLLNNVADIYCHPSFREGLPVSIMEAMSMGLPCVVSKIRGSSDLIQSGEGGYLFSATDVNGFAIAISELSQNIDLRQRMGAYNRETMQRFDIKNVLLEMDNIYKAVFESL